MSAELQELKKFITMHTKIMPLCSGLTQAENSYNLASFHVQIINNPSSENFAYLIEKVFKITEFPLFCMHEESYNVFNEIIDNKKLTMGFLALAKCFGFAKIFTPNSDLNIGEQKLISAVFGLPHVQINIEELNKYRIALDSKKAKDIVPTRIFSP